METFSDPDGEFVTDAPPALGPKPQKWALPGQIELGPLANTNEFFMTQNPMYYSSAKHETPGQIELADYSQLFEKLCL